MLINLLRIDEVLVNNLNTNIACTYCIHEVTINLMTIENVIDIKNDDKKNSKRETNYYHRYNQSSIIGLCFTDQ